MKFETLLSFVNKGRVKAHSIVRGPTTHQLWKFAAQVRGLSREFGLCYSCGAEIDRDTATCPQCNRTQTLPAQPDAFLETAEAETPATVYRELPPSAVAPIQAATPPAASVDQNVAAANEPQVPPGASDTFSPAASNAPAPVVDSNSDMIIPSLPDKPPAPTARPSTPRERLANLNRATAGEGEADEFDDPGDIAFDDGPARPPGQIGPAFVAGGRTPQPGPRRRKWMEAAMFVLVLLAAAGSGLLYVDPALQTSVQAWTNNMLGVIGITSSPKRPITPLAGTDVTNPLPSATQIPPTNYFRTVPVPVVHAPPAVPQTMPHSSPAPAAVQLPETPSAAPPQNTAPAAPPIANDAQPASLPTQPAAVVPAPAPLPADNNVANDSSTSPQTGDDDPFTKARNLRNKGIDEENSGHYAAAVSLFEQIKQLPRDTWPGDLELRLKAAKANAEGAARR